MSTQDSTMPPEAAHDPITQCAASYAQRRRFETWTDADQVELEAWLIESTAHRVAFLRLEAAATQAKELFALRGHRAVPAAGNEAPKRLPWRFALPLLAAASVVMAATFEKPIVNYLMQAPESTYSTEIGGRTLLTFADRTQIELNTDTVLHFRITGEERTVWLDKGEAWFHVAHNAANPFTVIVGKRRVTDLGTEFLIRREPDHTEVALLTGRATLSADGTPTTMLTPGDDAIATLASVSVTRKTPKELADALAWRHGMLVFRDTKLADVVAEFNRYNKTKLVIADPSIADETINGDARTDDYEGLLQLVEIGLKLHVEHEGNEILISREQREKTNKGVRIKHAD